MDLKPANILLDGKNMVPKITDFDLSRPDENSHTTGQCVGTQGYIAPEYRDASKTSMKCDIYSLGVVIIELVTGCKGLPDEHKVLRRWRHRWSKPPTILQLQQVTRCIKIGVRCREKKPEHRPPISEIISFLGEPASTDDHTSQICPDYNEDDMLGIKPLELRLPSEGKKEISCSVELTNDTANCIAFNIQPSRPRLYGAQPNKGIVRPQSKYGVKITVPPQHIEHVEKFIIKSRKVSEGLGDETIIECMFEEAGIVVDEVDLKIKYNPIFEKSKLLPERAIFSRHYHTNMKYLQEESDQAVDVTRGAMGSVLDKLGKLITEENNLEHNMKIDIESFSQELMKLHLDLPKLEKHDGVKFWVNEVKELSYKIEDMVDGLLVPVEHESTSSELSDEGLDPWQYAINHIGRVIKDIKNKVQCVTDNRNMYNFDVNNVLANVKAKATTGLQIWAKKDKEELIGIEKPRDELISLFEEDGNVPNNKLKIFSIVGMGGLGKTTLVKAVYDKLEAQYHPMAFVKVGQNVDVKVVLKNILTGCGKDATNMEHLDVEQLTSQLQQLLMYERYFIVIDDLWDSETMNNETWDTIKFALPGNNYGIRVITTTRIDHVARACCYDEMKCIRMMNPLSDNDSRTLFLSRIFGPKEPCPDALKDISIHILKRCGGLPLAINSIANLLIGDQRRSTWDDVRQNWSAMMKGNALERMNQILDLSYVHLPYQLKTCLLYVGMYQNSNKDLHHMLRKWVAEGFVEKSTNDEVDEDVAELYLRALRGMCMLQVDKVGYCNGDVLHYRVHPIMLDLIRVKAAIENFIHVIDGSKSMGGDIHRVSVHHNDKVDKQIWGAIEEGSLSHVRSVFLRRSSLVPYFLELKYVRVLHIEYKYSSMDGLDLTGINRLSLLWYLKVSSVDESIYELKLPSKIGDLQELETIDLHNASLKNYPSDIVSLPWLRHLISTGNKVGVVLPDEIERLETLRTLVGGLNGRSVHTLVEKRAMVQAGPAH
ncbi:disease resistance protein RGA5 isoform X2 [Triticum aestivum]|nr:disease resistance protein RGA5-like isoform X2 [Triticum aestivum]XP_044408497.1 disease resistance protein RGA5-like isoform X2 [Triticum aestivum]XP_044408498.1 disease resistance protein RGA5-like isoform X2 [Triticum aestivum]XP_044408499.1 disease resistance protein RGA5-like isoform X2 [Triticum aestivum]XP_044408501.1 disease resistance protein RGA5-like isoform X2 [Triticum aestivum]